MDVLFAAVQVSPGASAVSISVTFDADVAALWQISGNATVPKRSLLLAPQLLAQRTCDHSLVKGERERKTGPVEKLAQVKEHLRNF